MQKWNTVAIVGVGLIGGSIGLALRRRKLAERVVGIGRRPGSLRVAKRTGCVDSTTTSIEKGVSQADLIVVCTPVEQVVGHVQVAAAACPDGALITDAGSTKGEIVAGLNGSLRRGVRFVGSHPLAGSEKTGPGAATAELFQGRVVVLTPAHTTSRDDVRLLSRFWTSLGARVLEMSPEEHDRALAATSHLPHLVSSALAAATPPACLPLTSSGWADTTRVAAGDPELWTQIFSANRDHVLASLTQFEQVLRSLRTAIERGDRRRVLRILTEGKQNRDAVGS